MAMLSSLGLAVIVRKENNGLFAVDEKWLHASW